MSKNYLRTGVSVAGLWLVTSLFSSPVFSAQCMFDDSDTDGDGWGFENGQSCRVAGNDPKELLPKCVSVDSDPDGDGYGWENGKSCRVTGSSLPKCTKTDSDPDGDGWGWENNRSCRVSDNGLSKSTAIKLELGEFARSTAKVNSVAKWFVFDTPEGAYQLDGKVLHADAYVDVSVLNNDDAEVGYVYGDGYSEEYSSLKSSVMCFAGGRHYLRVYAYSYDSDIDNAYEVTLTKASKNCQQPRYSISSADARPFTHIPGGYVFQNANNAIEARMHDGTSLWTYDPVDSYVTAIESSSDGEIFYANYDGIYSLGKDGVELWSYPLDNYAENITVGEDGIYFNKTASVSVTALNRDGSERWFYSGVHSFIEGISIGDDGTVYVRGYQQILAMDP